MSRSAQPPAAARAELRAALGELDPLGLLPPHSRSRLTTLIQRVLTERLDELDAELLSLTVAARLGYAQAWEAQPCVRVALAAAHSARAATQLESRIGRSE